MSKKKFNFDYNATFNNAKNIFAEIHFNNGKEKEGLALLAKPSLWTFKVSKSAYILHDKDIEENGEPKCPHIHFMFEAEESHSKQSWIDLLFEMFKPFCGDNREAVTVTVTQYERGALRYLLHADNSDKAQYERSRCISTPAEWLDEALKPEPNVNPTWDDLLQCHSRHELFDMVGPSNYSRMLKAWEDAQMDAKKESMHDDAAAAFYELRAYAKGFYSYLCKAIHNAKFSALDGTQLDHAIIEVNAIEYEIDRFGAMLEKLLEIE